MVKNSPDYEKEVEICVERIKFLDENSDILEDIEETLKADKKLQDEKKQSDFNF